MCIRDRLYISQQIMRAHGGHIEVQSRPGEGSTFSALLPLEGAAAGAGAGVQETHPGSGGPGAAAEEEALPGAHG